MAVNNFAKDLLMELFTSPLNIALFSLCLFLLYKILASMRPSRRPTPKPPMPKMKKKDFTVSELAEYEGEKDGRVLVAVNGKVFDVTRGKRFYGPDGPYGAFAGHDASRALATFSLEKDAIKSEYDNLSDLTAEQMESVREWEMQFHEKYDYVGKLLKPGEDPSEYSDDDTSESHSEPDKKEK